MDFLKLSVQIFSNFQFSFNKNRISDITAMYVRNMLITVIVPNKLSV